MTVRELMQRLGRMPPDAEVTYRDWSRKIDSGNPPAARWALEVEELCLVDDASVVVLK